jgi:hypothetical protein
MAKKKVASKNSKKQKPAGKKVAQKAKISASAKKTGSKAKAVTKKGPAVKARARAKAKAKPVPKRMPPSPRASGTRGSQDVETVRLEPKSRVARAGAGSGDLQGISIVEAVDSESPDELLEEGQAFEAGIVKGVEDAGDAEESEVITHEVLEDDVPKEYDDEDRP